MIIIISIHHKHTLYYFEHCLLSLNVTYRNIFYIVYLLEQKKLRGSRDEQCVHTD